jgi:hypothetical protein
MVMKELFDNACDAAGAGEIRVSGGWLTVSDDGPGIPGTDDEIAALFSPGRPLRSSKLLRRPTRGAMGNGLRVVVGAALATGGMLLVDTCGRRLRLKPRDDGGTAIVESGPSDRAGAAVSVYLPGFTWPDHDLLTMFPTDNPYQGKSSPWWYTTDAFRELLQASPVTVRELMASMEGLSGANAGKVAEDFKGRDARSLTIDEIDALLRAARAVAREVKPERLGAAGPLDGFQYAKMTGVHDHRPARGTTSARVPFVIEAWGRAAKSRTQPQFTIMVNRSPVMAPRRTLVHKLADKWDAQYFEGCGLRMSIPCGRFAGDVVVNITAPYLPRTDNGKAPDLSGLAEPIRKALEQALSRAKRASPSQVQTSQRDAIIEALPAAAAHASDDGKLPFNLRQLFYGVRPVLLAAGFKEPDYGYFSRVVADFENEHGRIEKMTRDPRGILYHPHTREEIPIGTDAVSRYKRPEWTFNSVLYIEKEGLIANLRALGWPEANDCALMTGKGQASGAVKDLIDLLGDGDGDLLFFCLHDADGPGTQIYESLQEGTRARPNRRNVQIINLGLDPEEALAMGLDPEPVERKGDKRIPVASYVPHRWDEWLQSNRIELNAMSTRQFVVWLDRKIATLAPAKCRKVVPPVAHLEESLKSAVRGSVLTNLQRRAILEAGCAERAEKAVESLAPTFATLAPTLPARIAADLEGDPSRLWTEPVKTLAADLARTVTR